MQILIFDMDGVLLEPNGYHRALQETVRLTSLALGFEAFTLLPEDIARFESIGISNEWHSSAFCMALMVIEALKHDLQFNVGIQLEIPEIVPRPLCLHLGRRLSLIGGRIIQQPAIRRVVDAIDRIARIEGVDPDLAISIVETSDSIEHSLTFNVFQELVLGSVMYEQTYDKKSQLNRESYLKMYDLALLGSETRAALLSWLEDPMHCAAIMTNRPSNSLFRMHATSEAELGASLVGLDQVPLIGFGEMSWLARKKNVDVATLLKPGAQHALAAILAASGLAIEESLHRAHSVISEEGDLDFEILDRSSIYVFEDTPAGILAVENAATMLKSAGIRIEVEKIGISHSHTKRKALDQIGAKVQASVDEALDSAILINDP